MRLFCFAPFGVHPPRSAGHLAVHVPLRLLAERGHSIDLVTTGLRSFERRLPWSFRQDICAGFREHRLMRAWHLAKQALGGRTRLPPVDLADCLERWMSQALRSELASADLAQTESPWPFEFLKRHFDGPVAFVAHNVECDLHERALRAAGGAALFERARQGEARAWREADLVFVYHEDERRRMEALYGAPRGRCVLQPGGAEVDVMRPATAAERAAARHALEVPPNACVALFAGSAHAPNLEAASFLMQLGREAQRNAVFLLIAGSVASAPRTFRGGATTGPLPSLEPCFHAADIALNPMFSGSGMNHKVAQFLALGLPVLSTPFGARGFSTGEAFGLLTADTREFGPRLFALAKDTEGRTRLARAARDYAVRELSWQRIATERLALYEEIVAAARAVAVAP